MGDDHWDCLSFSPYEQKPSISKATLTDEAQRTEQPQVVTPYRSWERGGLISKKVGAQGPTFSGWAYSFLSSKKGGAPGPTQGGEEGDK